MLLLLVALTCILNRGISYAQERVLSENRVYIGYRLSDGYYSVKAYFNPAHVIQNGEQFDLVAGRNVRQAYVRAQSTGLKILGIRICGTFDTGRLYSRSASTSKPDCIYATPDAEVKDCNTCTQKANYGWIYY